MWSRGTARKDIFISQGCPWVRSGYVTTRCFSSPSHARSPRVEFAESNMPCNPCICPKIKIQLRTQPTFSRVGGWFFSAVVLGCLCPCFFLYRGRLWVGDRDDLGPRHVGVLDCMPWVRTQQRNNPEVVSGFDRHDVVLTPGLCSSPSVLLYAPPLETPTWPSQGFETIIPTSESEFRTRGSNHCFFPVTMISHCTSTCPNAPMVRSFLLYSWIDYAYLCTLMAGTGSRSIPFRRGTFQSFAKFRSSQHLLALLLLCNPDPPSWENEWRKTQFTCDCQLWIHSADVDHTGTWLSLASQINFFHCASCLLYHGLLLAPAVRQDCTGRLNHVHGDRSCWQSDHRWIRKSDCTLRAKFSQRSRQLRQRSWRPGRFRGDSSKWPLLGNIGFSAQTEKLGEEFKTSEPFTCDLPCSIPAFIVSETHGSMQI